MAQIKIPVTRKRQKSLPVIGGSRMSQQSLESIGSHLPMFLDQQKSLMSLHMPKRQIDSVSSLHFNELSAIEGEPLAPRQYQSSLESRHSQKTVKRRMPVLLNQCSELDDLNVRIPPLNNDVKLKRRKVKRII